MQSEILRGLERFSRGNYAHMHRLDASVARLDATEAVRRAR